VCCSRLRTGIGVTEKHDPGQVTVFLDVQAAIRRMASDEPGPGQQCAIQARKHIATLRRARPSITIEIQLCPAHKDIADNEKADEWAKISAEEPDTHRVEWLSYGYGDRSEVRALPLPRSLANLKQEISEKKWVKARQWAGGRTSKMKYRMPKGQKPDGVVAGSTKRLASRFYQLKTGHCLTGQYLNWTKNRPTSRNAGGAGIGYRPGTTSSRNAPNGSRSRKFCGRRCLRRQREGRAGGRSETFWQTRGAAGRY